MNRATWNTVTSVKNLYGWLLLVRNPSQAHYGPCRVVQIGIKEFMTSRLFLAYRPWYFFISYQLQINLYLTAEATGPYEQLTLALSWHRADIAKNRILTDKVAWEVS